MRFTCAQFFYRLENVVRIGDFGDDSNPSNTQSASKMVKSFSWPKNNEDNSNSLIFSLTVAPRTYNLKNESDIMIRLQFQFVQNNAETNRNQSNVLSVFLGTYAYTIELPPKINIQIVANCVHDFTRDHFI